MHVCWTSLLLVALRVQLHQALHPQLLQALRPQLPLPSPVPTPGLFLPFLVRAPAHCIPRLYQPLGRPHREGKITPASPVRPGDILGCAPGMRSPVYKVIILRSSEMGRWCIGFSRR